MFPSDIKFTRYLNHDFSERIEICPVQFAERQKAKNKPSIYLDLERDDDLALLQNAPFLH